MTKSAQRSIGARIAFKIRRQFRHGSFRAWRDHAVSASFGVRKRVDYYADGIGVRGKNLSFLTETRFAAAWKTAAEAYAKSPGGMATDAEWRAHIACWAASHGLTIEGDFVECGVHVGVLSRTICEYLDFAKIDRRFWLFDTFSGIPNQGESPQEAAEIGMLNRLVYKFDIFDAARQNFVTFPNAILVRGILPASLTGADFRAIAYLSIDLNNVSAERATIEALWNRLTPGAIVLLDDYACLAYSAQHDMWNDFAKRVGRMIATLPTGQGLLIK